MLRANRLRFYVSPTSALQALFNLREQHGQRSGEATRLLGLPPHAQLQPQPMVCSAKQNYLQTLRSSTALCQAPLLSNQQTQLTISRNSLLSAETASYQQNSSCLPAELPALHQQNTLVFTSNHVAASRIISCILCSSVGFIQAFRANFTHILLFWDYQLSPLSHYLYNSQPGYCARTICVGCYNPPRTQLTAFYVQNCIQELSSNIPLNAKFRAK